jgi:hypothetical protein
MSYGKAPQVQKKNVEDRIQVLVKGTIFRKLKSITIEAMFIGEFVACVSGTKVWGRKKYYYWVLETVIDRGSQELVVTVSDEAFAILLYENYMDN